MRKEKRNNLIKLKKWENERRDVNGYNGKQRDFVDGKDNIHRGKSMDKKKKKP